MSEVRYRGLLRAIHNTRSGQFISRVISEPEYTQFTGALLESHLPLVVQLRMIFARDDLEIRRQAVRVAHSVRIHELAPDLIQLFKTTTPSEEPFIKNAIVLALNYLHHKDIHAFMLALLQSPENVEYRRTAVLKLKDGKVRPELALHFFHMAEDISELTDMRCHAIEGLLHHGGGLRVLSLLVPLLQDHSGQVRWTALRAFEKHGNVFFASAIKPLINDNYQVDKAVPNGTLARSILHKWSVQEE